jgi:hypothetical protein
MPPPARAFAYVVARIARRSKSSELSKTAKWGAGSVTHEICDLTAEFKVRIWGAVIGAVAISLVGFSIFGWTLRDTAERVARERAHTAVVDALAPICVERFRQQPDAPAKLKEFAKAKTWDQRSIIENGGWATMPGTDAPNSAVASACAERLGRSL